MACGHQTSPAPSPAPPSPARLRTHAHPPSKLQVDPTVWPVALDTCLLARNQSTLCTLLLTLCLARWPCPFRNQTPNSNHPSSNSIHTAACCTAHSPQPAAVRVSCCRRLGAHTHTLSQPSALTQTYHLLLASSVLLFDRVRTQPDAIAISADFLPQCCFQCRRATNVIRGKR